MPPDAQLMVDTPTDNSTTSTHILALEACTEQTPPDAQHMVDKPCRNAKVAAGVLPKGRRNACCQHAPVGPGHGNLSIEHMFPCKYAQICLKRPAKHTCMQNRYTHTHTLSLPLTRTHTHAHAHVPGARHRQDSHPGAYSSAFRRPAAPRAAPCADCAAGSYGAACLVPVARSFVHAHV